MSVVAEPDALWRVRRLAARLIDEPWFAAVGEALTPAETAEAEAYLAALDLSGLTVVGVDGWAAAARLTTDPDWDHRWWDREERARTDLLRQLDDLPQPALLRALTEVTQAASRTVHGAAALAAIRAGVVDQGLTAAAAGAATQACYQQALAEAAGASSKHAFSCKYRLLISGRWPLGIVDGALHLF